MGHQYLQGFFTPHPWAEHVEQLDRVYPWGIATAEDKGGDAVTAPAQGSGIRAAEPKDGSDAKAATGGVRATGASNSPVLLQDFVIPVTVATGYDDTDLMVREGVTRWRQW